MSLKRILALSSSRKGSAGYLETALPLINNFLGPKPLNIAFIPFASVEKNYDAYFSIVKNAFINLPYKINLVINDNAKAEIENCDVIMVGGGNSFKLLHDLYETNILEIIRQKINAGTPFIGWSAGSNILCPGIYTTNDMPVIEPKSFKALNIFSFQINPHYYNVKPEGFNGETRDQRLIEFIKMNVNIPIVCLPEGAALVMEKKILKFVGSDGGILFKSNEKTEIVRKNIDEDSDLSYLI